VQPPGSRDAIFSAEVVTVAMVVVVTVAMVVVATVAVVTAVV
jgi:hypothetical protein